MAFWNRKWERRFDLTIVVTAISLLAGSAWFVWAYRQRSPNPGSDLHPSPLVVYCAHDSVYAAAILRSFEEQTGIHVEPRYDTEATKSLGLVNLILAERQHPRCDVFWNNEPLAMMQLRRAGVLAAYRGPGYERIPTRFKDPEGYWTGFAARLRVQALNTQKLSVDVKEAVTDSTLPGNLSTFAIAKPLYGTTLMHYSLLWKLWGGERLKAWHRDIRKRGAREVAGNGPAMELVASGECSFCWTDTDDFFVARDEGKSVEMLPITVETTGAPNGNAKSPRVSICIPNTTAIIQGTQHLEAAQRLVDFLLSAETELALAKSQARQIPLGPVAATALPAEVRDLQGFVSQGADLFELDAARTECLEWLKSEYLR